MFEVILDINIIKIIRFRIIASKAKRVMRRWERWVTMVIIDIIIEKGIREEGINSIVIVLGEVSLFLVYKTKAYTLASNTNRCNYININSNPREIRDR